MTPEELLNGVGEPVAYQERQQTNDGFTEWYDAYAGADICGQGSKVCGGIEYQWRGLYTSDKVAAAILKATKRLEEEVEFQRTAHRRAEEMMLEQGAQLAAEQLNNKLLREALEFLDARIVTMDLGGVVERALSTPASTEALDAYVTEKVKEALYFTEATINLAPGEHYAGLVIGKDGKPSYHLVLLPGQADDITWDKAMEWAVKQGGEYVASLPTRREQALLFANLKEEFEERAYWSCETHESESGWAWYQHFYDGSQSYDGRSYERRARAVRRLPIQSFRDAIGG